jgi:nitrogen regulatory protein PII
MADFTIQPDAAGHWTAGTVSMGPDILDRMERAVTKVRERLLRATAALNQASIPYAVVGGNAVASWVATVDEGAVRNTRDVDILVRRADLSRVTTTLEQVGFVAGRVMDVVMFRDGEEGKPSEAIHLLFAGEKLQAEHLLPMPEIETVVAPSDVKVLRLESLVTMKLMSNRRKDQVHLLDLISVGLIDGTWPSRFPPELGQRLQHLLETPDG